MRDENTYLNDEQAFHLTNHAVQQNEDGTYSWKFDNHMSVWEPNTISQEENEKLWQSITCPTLLLYGANSWASNPEKDGRMKHFQNAEVKEFSDAGHWLHHDQFEEFMSTLDAFL